MPILSMQIIAVLAHFSSEFTKASWEHAKLLITGAILCIGPRRVTAVLRVLGLSQEKRFEKYHRILNRAKWNSVTIGKVLFGLLLKLLPESWPILIAVDETLERRKGKRIKAKGCYRDAVRSSQTKVIKCFGLRWNCMALLVPLPWCKRIWALPFLTILEPSKKADEAANQQHKTSIDWTIVMVKLVCRWLKQHPWILIGDGGYACMDLALCCVKQAVTLITRFRLDAQLYDFPEAVDQKKRGRKRIKGKRIYLKELVKDTNQEWTEAEVKWYGGIKKRIKLLTKTCLWYQAGKAALPVRFVLVVGSGIKNNAEAFFSTNVNVPAEKIIEWFVLRWNIEVAFEEARAHLGVETQRQWSDKAIARTTPILMSLLSLVVLMGLELKKDYQLLPNIAAWYDKKDEVTFSDLIAYVRRHIWSCKYFSKSANQSDFVKLDKSEFNWLINQLSMAA